MLPFNEKKIGESTFLREFKETTKNTELIWHRDAEDRLIKVINSSDWYLQLDNELPKKLEEGKEYFIERHKYHRVIKGSGNLLIELKKCESTH